MREHGVRRVREGARQDDAAAVRSALQHQHPGLAAPGPGRHDQQGECDQGPRRVELWSNSDRARAPTFIILLSSAKRPGYKLQIDSSETFCCKIISYAPSLTRRSVIKMLSPASWRLMSWWLMDAIRHNCCLSLLIPGPSLVANCSAPLSLIVLFCSTLELFCVWRLLWAVQPLPQPPPPEAEAVRDVLRDCGEEEDLLSRDWHHSDTQPTPGRWFLAWNGNNAF